MDARIKTIFRDFDLNKKLEKRKNIKTLVSESIAIT